MAQVKSEHDDLKNVLPSFRAVQAIFSRRIEAYKEFVSLGAPLRTAGTLSAFLFGVICCFEILQANDLHRSQLFIVSILQFVLAVWSLAEVYSKDAEELQIPLRQLKLLMWVQVGLVCLRQLLVSAKMAPIYGLLGGEDIVRSLPFMLAQFAVFICILNSLIDAFAYQERQRAQQLNIARLELKSKLRASLMASGIAHEINQPLSTILLNIELALNEIRSPSLQLSSLQSRLSQIGSDSSHVVSTIATMRNLLRAVQTEHQPYSLVGVIKTALLQEKSALVSRSILVKTYGLSNDIQLIGDGGQIQMAIGNLLRNAFESISSVGASKARIEIRLVCKQNHICLQIADSGTGFSQHQLEGLPFKTPRPKGSGLGLYLVSIAMENNHGSLVIGNSKKLGGAEITMLFPRQEFV